MKPEFQSYSRRRFLQYLIGTGTLTVSGLDPIFAQGVPVVGAEPFRFTFVTDLHLLQDGGLRSAEGIAACLAAVEKLEPRPEFILVGGDLVNRARDLTIDEAEKRLDLFLKIWNDHTSLPVHWIFGNHDLAGTSNPAVLPDSSPLYGKGLFKDRLKLSQLFYSFDFKGWHFVVLDDIDPLPDRTYQGLLFDNELAFLQADLEANRSKPTIVCTHIPILSNLPMGLLAAHTATGQHVNPAKNLVCTNGGKLVDDIPGHNVRAVLAGHLHFFEKIEMKGVQFINSGAVCGSYWKGPLYGCPEGFGIVDLGADGSVAFDYHPYGWKVA